MSFAYLFFSRKVQPKTTRFKTAATITNLKKAKVTKYQGLKKIKIESLRADTRKEGLSLALTRPLPHFRLAR
jgi:hypothetical protein